MKSRVNVRHLKWSGLYPVLELLANSNLDVFPGQSKLYLHSKDLEDLDWPAMIWNAELDKDTNDKLEETVHDRRNNTVQQTNKTTTQTTNGQDPPSG